MASAPLLGSCQHSMDPRLRSTRICIQGARTSQTLHVTNVDDSQDKHHLITSAEVGFSKIVACYFQALQQQACSCLLCDPDASLMVTLLHQAPQGVGSAAPSKAPRKARGQLGLPPRPRMTAGGVPPSKAHLQRRPSKLGKRKSDWDASDFVHPAGLASGAYVERPQVLGPFLRTHVPALHECCTYFIGCLLHSYQLH